MARLPKNVDDLFGRRDTIWPHGVLGDNGPFHSANGVWRRPNIHRPYNPPNYDDWDEANPFDYRDRDWAAEDIDPLTGLPPSDHQGVEYRPGHARWANDNGHTPRGVHVNMPVQPHPFGKKRRLAWVWPSDGKRKHTWGRWKDLLEGTGPDIFVTKYGNRPSRNQWKNNFQDLTTDDPGWNTHVDMPWARRRKPYDFRERTYRRKGGVGDIFWSDATWPRRGADHYKQPINYRCEHGRWFNMAWSTFGGVVLNGYNNPVRKRDIWR